MAASSHPAWVTDSYITPWALPKEGIVAYVKWDTDMPMPQVTIKTEADVWIHRILNVNDESWKTYDFTTGRFDVKKEHLQIKGFIGFEARYIAVPEAEKEVKFVLDFSFEGRPDERVELTTEIIRPILGLKLLTEEIAAT